jgi:signal transduction histidine kinase
MTALRTTRYWIGVVLLALVYILAGKLGLQLAFVHPNATAVWPPTGIALGSLLVWGYRLWPGVFLGAYMVNISTAGSIGTSIGIATGNTLEGLLGAYLLNRFANGRQAFNRPADVFKFAGLAGLASTMVSATIGVASLAAGGYADWATFGSIWLTWWLGDAAGALIVAPVLILWSASLRVQWRRRQAMEASFVGLLIVLTGWSVFGGLVSRDSQPYPLSFLCAPLLVWTAFRFTQREAATVTLLISGFALVGTLHGYGPFAMGTPHESLLLLQAFMASMAMIALGVVAAVSDRSQPGSVSKEEPPQIREMATLGRFAGGIVHDFNNILYVIRMYSELLASKGSLGKDDLRAIEEIGHATKRASSLTAQLLAFSRREVVQPMPLNLNTVFLSMESMLRQLIGNDIVLNSVLFPALGTVRIDPTQLEQVLLNLVVNARDAMPQGGQLTIETANVDLDEAYVSQHAGARRGAHVMLAVRDTGIGMDAATKARIFEPFFTTKGTGGGTGLGLSIIYGIVKQSGGYVTVDSAPGSGTTFRVYLPRAGDSSPIARTAPP